MANLIELTEWLTGKGQGYRITAMGREVLNDPMYLDQLRAGPMPVEDQPIPFGVNEAAVNRFDKGEQVRGAFYEPTPPRVVPFLIGLNSVVFLVAMVVAGRTGVGWSSFLANGNYDTMQRLGALSAADLVGQQYWRLLSNCFLHFGLMHLTLNMASLYMMRNVESLWGGWRFLVLYLICGLAGSALAVYLNPGTLERIALLAGASGAIWGVMCSQIAWLLINRMHLPPDQLQARMRQLSYTLILNIGISMLPNVSVAAHMGGGAVGFMAALLLQIHRYGLPSKRNLAGIQLALLPTIIMLALSTALENDDRFKPFRLEQQRKDELPAVAQYLDELKTKLDPLATELDHLDPVAEQLYLQATKDREANAVRTLTNELDAWLTQVRDAKQWLDASTPVSTATALKEAASQHMKTMLALGEAMQQRLTNEQNPPVRTARLAWSTARTAWEKERRK